MGGVWGRGRQVEGMKAVAGGQLLDRGWLCLLTDLASAKRPRNLRGLSWGEQDGAGPLPP